jgi:glycosyltransferase involved in cell wall biosynthesis
MTSRRVRPVTQASVIVPARNAAETLPRTLEALAKQDLGGPYEVIVVDDGSTDGTAESASAAAGPVRVLSQPPQGPAAARNRGVAEAHAEVLAFCDADCFPTPGWLRAGVEALRSADLVQGRVEPDPSAPRGPCDRTLEVGREGGLYETACLFVTRETLERAGWFEEWLDVKIGISMFEDTWLAWRARRLGARTAFCPEAVVHHAVFPRGWREYVAERRRLRYFPALAAQVPELRRRFFYRRLFLNRRGAALDAALAGSLAALALRSPLPLLALAPYGWMAAERPRRFHESTRPGARIGIAAADVGADLVGLAALVRGSVRYRSPLL